MRKRFLSFVLVILFAFGLINLVHAKSMNGVLNTRVYDAQPIASTDDSVYFEIFYYNLLLGSNKSDSYLAPRIVKYDLGNKTDSEILKLKDGERVLEFISSEDKEVILTYDAGKIVALYIRDNNKIVKMKKLFKSSIRPYTFTKDDQIYLAYEEIDKTREIVTKLISIDTKGHINLIKECKMSEDNQLYSGDYISVLGGSDESLFACIITLDDGNFEGLNTTSTLYELTNKNKLETTGVKYDFLLQSITGNDNYLIANEYNKEDPYAITLNVFDRNKKKNFKIENQINKYSIKEMFVIDDKLLVRSDKIYLYNLNNRSFDVLDTEYFTEKKILKNGNLYFLNPVNSIFEIRSMRYD